MKLSVLVCSTHNRYKSFLPIILDNLFYQVSMLPSHLQDEVEVITVIDNKMRMLGTKRNDLLNMAQGDYVVFVDDDDRVEPDYVFQLLKAIVSQQTDVITFTVSVSLNGGLPLPCYYSKEYAADYNIDGKSYHRLPNHIMCVRRDLALQVRYKDILNGEDSDYSKRLHPLLNTQHTIDKVLYHYDYDSNITETQKRIKRKGC